MALTMAPINAFASGAPLPRLSGDTAELTAVAIAELTGSTGTAILASSTSYGMVDALAGAPLAARTKSAIVLTDGTVPAAAAFINAKLTAHSVVTALGGVAVVPAQVLDGIGYNVPAPK